MTHKSKITPATSPLFCNRTTYIVKHRRYMFDLLILMAHKRSYVTVMINKCRYSSKIAVFNMSTIILHNTRVTRHHSLKAEATVNET